MNISELIKKKRIYFDGGMGTLLQENGLLPGELPENWNIRHKEILTKIHLNYLNAGSNIITTNTFGANLLKFDNLEDIISSGIDNAKKAIELSKREDCFVAFDMGPLGKILKPLGDLDFEDAVEIFGKSVRIAEKYKPDLILIETMNDSYETKAAVLSSKENSDLPVFVTNVYDENMKLMTGASPKAMIAMLEGLGVDAIGMNCSIGPRQMKRVAEEYIKYSSLPVIVNPNAGLPKNISGKTVYDVSADEFSDIMAEIAECGVTILGGCCGTTPEYIKKTVEKTKNLPFKPCNDKNITFVSSYTHAVEFGNEPVLIGERINPTGKKKFKEALREGNINYIINEGIAQQEKGVAILDVNVGLPEIDETEMMKNVVTELQAVLDLPLQIDTVNPKAMEKAMRIYNGKPLINSVNGKAESMDFVFPLIKKYGGVVIALTIDEKGIPETAIGRYEIAKKIVAKAEKYGINKEDIIVDPLAMTISSDKNSARVALDSIKLIKENLEVKTSLGVSNISFGLPDRDAVNSVFFAMALEKGLDAAIMNPYSVPMMRAYFSFMALSGNDDGCLNYIDFAETHIQTQTKTVAIVENKEEENDGLIRAIVKGLKNEAFEKTLELTKTTEPMEIINSLIIPALDMVGKRFEEKTMYLPQLLMSAEAASRAFEAVKSVMKSDESAKKGKIILAAVKGDIHDIGKNIVKVLLENYGYEVIDLGKDVEPEKIVKTAKERNVKLVGLSALMTTTVISMEETVKLLRSQLPDVKTVVGGAVLTQEYADMIGASHYSRDAMDTVRYASTVTL